MTWRLQHHTAWNLAPVKAWVPEGAGGPRTSGLSVLTWMVMLRLDASCHLDLSLCQVLACLHAFTSEWLTLWRVYKSESQACFYGLIYTVRCLCPDKF